MNMLKLSKTQVSPDADKIKRLKLWNCSRPTWSLQSSGNGGKTWVQPADMLHRLIRLKNNETGTIVTVTQTRIKKGK